MAAAVPERRGSAALEALCARIEARREDLARQMVDRVRREVVDYRLVEDDGVLDDLRAFALQNVDALTWSLRNAEDAVGGHLERAGAAARRRLHQRVSLESFLHAGRVYARLVWDAVLDAAGDRPAERAAALAAAGQVLALLDAVSTVATTAYLDELSDRGLLRQELLDALLAGGGESERTRRRAAALRIRLAESYVAVVVRSSVVVAEPVRAVSPAGQSRIDRLVEAVRTRLQPAAGPLIAGMRHGDLVALYPVAEPGGTERVRADCAALLGVLDGDVGVGISGWHADLPALGGAYDEALDAVDIAVGIGVRDRAVTLDDVLVDHMLGSSSHADRILARTLQPVVDYDRTHSSDLVATLRAYLAMRLNLTRSSQLLSVHPNTVVYRLRRVRELTGRDPRDPDDLLVLSLALRLHALRERGDSFSA